VNVARSLLLQRERPGQPPACVRPLPADGKQRRWSDRNRLAPAGVRELSLTGCFMSVARYVRQGVIDVLSIGVAAGGLVGVTVGVTVGGCVRVCVGAGSFPGNGLDGRGRLHGGTSLPGWPGEKPQVEATSEGMSSRSGWGAPMSAQYLMDG